MTTNTQRLHAYLNAIDTHDRGAILDTYTDDVELCDPGLINDAAAPQAGEVSRDEARHRLLSRRDAGPAGGPIGS